MERPREAKDKKNVNPRRGPEIIEINTVERREIVIPVEKLFLKIPTIIGIGQNNVPIIPIKGT